MKIIYYLLKILKYGFRKLFGELLNEKFKYRLYGEYRFKNYDINKILKIDDEKYKSKFEEVKEIKETNDLLKIIDNIKNEFDKLKKENEELKKELKEKDETIDKFKSKLMKLIN